MQMQTAEKPLSDRCMLIREGMGPEAQGRFRSCCRSEQERLMLVRLVVGHALIDRPVCSVAHS
jgi:hypothetical protein